MIHPIRNEEAQHNSERWKIRIVLDDDDEKKRTENLIEFRDRKLLEMVRHMSIQRFFVL